jgi:hypothetical protein
MQLVLSTVDPVLQASLIASEFLPPLGPSLAYLVD